MSVYSNGSTDLMHAGWMNDVPDPQVAPKAKNRTFTAAYKKRILTEYEAASRDERGALLRRENLYSTLIRKWQNQAARAVEQALTGQRPGPKVDQGAKEVARLVRENERLEVELSKSRRINDVQAKLSALLDDLVKGADIDSRSNS